MPLVRFTQNIQRHVTCPPREVAGDTVHSALDAYFNSDTEDGQRARGYVLDERGALRQHMAIFLNGRPLLDRSGLSDAVAEGDTIDVMQALSGG